MDETAYRASRLCRVLGNPTAFQIVKALQGGRRRTPSELSAQIGVPQTTTSMTLRVLRLAEVVRYERQGRFSFYWLKYPATDKMIQALEDFVEHMRKKKE